MLGIIKDLLHLESKNSCSRCRKIKLTCLHVTAGLLSHCLDGTFSEGPFKRNKSFRCVYESSVLSSYNLKRWRFLLSLGKLNSSNSWGFFNEETLNFYIYFHFLFNSRGLLKYAVHMSHIKKYGSGGEGKWKEWDVFICKKERSPRHQRVTEPLDILWLIIGHKGNSDFCIWVRQPGFHSELIHS